MVYNEIHKTRSHRIYTHDPMLWDKEEQSLLKQSFIIINIIICWGDVKQSGESGCNQEFHNYNMYKSIVFA